MSECFICKQPDVKAELVSNGSVIYYKCPFCGEYAIDKELQDDIPGYGLKLPSNGKTKRLEESNFYSKAPSIAAERKLKCMDKYILVYDSELSCWSKDKYFTPIGAKAFLEEYPQDAIDMFNRILVNLTHWITHPSKKFPVEQYEKGKFSYFYSSDFDSFWEMCNQLKELGWIETNSSTGSNITVGVTPDGWRTLRELKPSKDSGRAFVAMWFSKETQPLRNAVRDAVTQAGYICNVVDEIHHNDYIMDKVLNLIKDSCFVIADFTSVPENAEEKGKIPGGVRGGVYYEAGFAKGLGRPVIVSCRDDANSKARIHFDIAQLSTIFWQQDGDKLITNGQDFVEFLKERIIATVGKGKHYKEQ